VFAACNFELPVQWRQSEIAACKRKRGMMPSLTSYRNQPFANRMCDNLPYVIRCRAGWWKWKRSADCCHRPKLTMGFCCSFIKACVIMCQVAFAVSRTWKCFCWCFLHYPYIDIAIFALGYFILPHPVQIVLRSLLGLNFLLGPIAWS